MELTFFSTVQPRRRTHRSTPSLWPSVSSHLLMYCYLRQRYSIVLQECILILHETSAMVPPARTLQHDARSKTPTTSTASSPSLRSKTPVNVPMPPSNLNPGGNVKVVVRVRGFLPRGEFCQLGFNDILLIILRRNRQRLPVLDRNEPRNSDHQDTPTSLE